MLSRFLADAVYIFHLLKLANTSLSKGEDGDDQQREFQNAFWVIYIMEKPLAIAQGRASIIDDRFFNLQLPQIFDEDKGASCFIIQCRYARICSIILVQLYSRDGQALPLEALSRKISLLDQLTETWRDDLRSIFWPNSGMIDKRAKKSNYLFDIEARWWLRGLYQYNEVKLCLQARRLMFLQSENDLEARGRVILACIPIAKAIVDCMSDSIGRSLIVSQQFTWLVMLATGVFFVGSMEKTCPDIWPLSKVAGLLVQLATVLSKDGCGSVNLPVAEVWYLFNVAQQTRENMSNTIDN
ncbi:uncharacterized protein LY89DRAFT_251698 [Mollisia scopiformis]|uniref:Transcription factor domain-containing protein n=1 Tax=Mollisia scopiformis TaxID=149040 RepID=A0A194WSD2_MOLSC|nr:uncharacterized protein LY89DRAFT_251698 [Mollisia scopiformis]KUJ10870.1 hypothetical protein LY89DRAFT_251698 [Mollisia scopiformis]